MSEIKNRRTSSQTKSQRLQTLANRNKQQWAKQQKHTSNTQQQHAKHSCTETERVTEMRKQREERTSKESQQQSKTKERNAMLILLWALLTAQM